jgi:hypothetical protein
MIIKNKHKSIPYSTRWIKMDRVGFEPTTSATNKGNKSSEILEVRLYSITLAYFLKNFAWNIVIIV